MNESLVGDELDDLLGVLDLNEDGDAGLAPRGGPATQDSAADLLSQLDSSDEDEDGGGGSGKVPIVNVNRDNPGSSGAGRAGGSRDSGSIDAGVLDDLDELESSSEGDSRAKNSTLAAHGGGTKERTESDAALDVLSTPTHKSQTAPKTTGELSLLDVQGSEDELSLPSVSARDLTFNNNQDLQDMFDDAESDIDVDQKIMIETAIDQGIMKMLHPDFLKAGEAEKRQELQKSSAILKNWSASKMEARIIRVSDKMAVLNQTEMYDSGILDNWDDEDKRAKFRLEPVSDLSEIAKIPAKYWIEDTQANNGHNRGKSFDTFVDRQQTAWNDGDFASGVAGIGTGVADMGKGGAKALSKGVVSGFKGVGKGVKGVGNLALGGGGKGDALIVCAGCGNECKFNRKRRHLDNFVAYKCKANDTDYIFHDRLCVNLRKIKEAIRRYVYTLSTQSSIARINANKSEANFVSIDKDVNIKPNPNERPVPFTTPMSDAASYEKPIPEVIGAFTSANLEDDIKVDTGKNGTVLPGESVYGDELAPRMTVEQDREDQKRVPYPNFRRYRVTVAKILERMNIRRVVGSGDNMDGSRGAAIATYNERFGNLPKELLYCDLNEYGISIFEFVSDALKSKYRKELWTVLRFIALELGTVRILDVLRAPRHTHLLTKHMLDDYDMLAKCVIEGSRFPIAASLKLSAFMYERSEVDLSNQADFRKIANSYLEIAKKMLKEIESDHLFSLLLQLPTDIDGDSIVDIALKHNLIFFLEDPRIVRVFSSIWSGGLDILQPKYTLQELDLTLDQTHGRLMSDPGKFYFSARGKFYTSSTLYCGYLFLFSYITSRLIFDYTPQVGFFESVLWICSFGYVTNEVIEFISEPGEYFSTFTNYWDILISMSWIVLAFFRFAFNNDRFLKYDSNGDLDKTRTRNQPPTQVYMAAWSLLCVLLWSRVVSLFQISQGPGPLIRMIMNMFKDIMNFGLICVLFLIGFTFATYYIIAGDLSDVDEVELGTITSVGLYIFQTLLAQQTWEKVDSVPGKFDPIRSNMALTLVLLFSVIGSILLLNLLIAMMASTYENVKEKSNSELNKQRIEKTYELDRSRNVIPPPLNVIAFIFYGYWASFELMAWVLTFGHKQFNEEWLSPLNKENDQYSEGDTVYFLRDQVDDEGNLQEGIEMHGVVELRQSVSQRLIAQQLIQSREEGLAKDANGGATSVANQEDANASSVKLDWTCKVFDISTGRYYYVSDNEITSVRKPLFKTRVNRIPNHNFESRYCKYCRWNLTNGDRMSIEYYLLLFKMRGDHIDPDDQQYMRDLLAGHDEFGLKYVKLCELCPNCYRPFKVDEYGYPDAVLKPLFMLEVISYLVFLLFVWWLLVIVLWPAANISKLSNYLSAVTQIGSETTEDKVRKSAMFRTETNEAYRAKVREASKEEEDQEMVVKRIDREVDKLQKTLLGRPTVAEEDRAGPSELDQDEFELAIHNMRAEINRRFEEMQDLLVTIEKAAKIQPRR